MHLIFCAEKIGVPDYRATPVLARRKHRGTRALVAGWSANLPRVFVSEAIGAVVYVRIPT